MRKEDLRSGMIIQTEHNRFGVVELENNRIDICYDPVLDDNYKTLEKVLMEDVFNFGEEQLGIGTIVTQELKEQFPSIYDSYKVGEVAIFYEIVAIYDLKQIYSNKTGIFPDIKV